MAVKQPEVARVALSIEEQLILDGMERKLAEDDPKLVSRLTAFGQPRLPAVLGTRRSRAIAVLISMVLAAIVVLMVYAIRPSSAGSARQSQQHHQRTQVVARPRGQQTGAALAHQSVAPGS